MMLRFLKIIGIVIGTILLMLILYPWVLRGLGYYVDNPGWEVGRIATEKGDVSLCKKIVVYSHFSGPTKMSRRGECVYTYAELAKDPSACELLMPSSYGLSCVGGAEDFDPCVMLADQKKTVKGQGIETTYDTCLTGPHQTQGHVCCKMAKVLYGKESECSSFPMGKLKDQCHHILAVKRKDLTECELIESKRNRTGCAVIVRAYQTGRMNQ